MSHFASYVCVCDELCSKCLLFTNSLFLYDTYLHFICYIVAGHFKLSGADNPGIVHKLTSVLAKNSLTIGNMKTSQEDAPFGGSQLFTSKSKNMLQSSLFTFHSCYVSLMHLTISGGKSGSI